MINILGSDYLKVGADLPLVVRIQAFNKEESELIAELKNDIYFAFVQIYGEDRAKYGE